MRVCRSRAAFGLVLWLVAALFLAVIAPVTSTARAQDVFSSGDQPEDGAPDGGDVYNGGNGADFGSVIPRSQCTGINQVWNMGRCNARQLPSQTGCGPWYNNYSYFIQDTLQHLGGNCQMHGDALWCPQIRAGSCNPSAGGQPGNPLVDTGIRFDQSCQSRCDFTAANQGGLLPPMPASNAPLQGHISNTPMDDDGCTGGAAPADQQTARDVSQTARQIAVQTVMGTGSFLQGSAEVIDDYARFLALPPGESVNQMGRGIQQAGTAVVDFWNNKDPHKHEALLQAAQGAVTAFQRDPAHGAGIVAGNLLLGYAGGGVCQVGKGAAATVAKRIAQARTATDDIAAVEKAAQNFARSTRETGGFPDTMPAHGSTDYGQPPGGLGNGGLGTGGQAGGTGGGLPGKSPQNPIPPINDRVLNTNCTQCTIAGLCRMMGRGIPTASDIMATAGDRTLTTPEVFDLLRKNFAPTPPKWLSAAQLQRHSQGVPIYAGDIPNLERELGNVLKSGAAGPGVMPKGVVFIDTGGGTGGHIIGAVQTPKGLRLIDWQNRVYDTGRVQLFFVDPLTSTGAKPQIWFYPVE